MPVSEILPDLDPVQSAKIESVLTLISNGYTIGDACIRARLPNRTMMNRCGEKYGELIKEAVANRRMQVSDVVAEKMKKDWGLAFRVLQKLDKRYATKKEEAPEQNYLVSVFVNTYRQTMWLAPLPEAGIVDWEMGS